MRLGLVESPRRIADTTVARREVDHDWNRMLVSISTRGDSVDLEFTAMRCAPVVNRSLDSDDRALHSKVYGEIAEGW